jgi:DNA transposition AAA+ family ATPase
MMTQEQKKQIMGALESYMSEHGISQNEVIKRSGVNSNYITEMRRGHYSVTVGEKEVAIADKYFQKIADLAGISTRKTYWKMQPTTQLKEALAVLEDARQFGDMNLVIGDTGAGKSYAIDLFKRKYPNEVFVVTVSQLDKIGDILDEIMELLKITPEKGDKKKLKAIVARLRDMKMEGRHPLLIFDECEYMKQITFNAVKEFHDKLVLPKYCGVVLSGHYQLASKVEKLKKSNREGIPQLYRRIKFGIRYLSEIDRTAGFDLFLSGIEDKSLRRFLCENCENYGELHDVLVPAFREADRTGEEVTENFVRKVLNFPVNQD